MHFRSTAIVLLFCLLPAAAAASTVRLLDDATLIATSDRVVHGRVVGQRTARGGSDPRYIYTITTLSVIEDLTGVDSDTVEVWELGGAIGDESMLVGGTVRFQPGSEVVVCLRRGPRGLHSVGMELGKFEVAPTGAEQPMVRRLEDTLVVGSPLPANRSLRQFRELARKVTGRASRRGRGAAAAEAARTPRAPEAVTFFGGSGGQIAARWVEADSSSPIRYYLNVRGNPASPVAPASAVPSVQAALAAWNDPAAASISLVYAGTTTQNSEGPWVGIPSNSVVISFEDPDGEINDPTLAITYAFAADRGGGTLHGTTFDGFTDAAIKFQNAAALPLQFRQSPGFTRILTHEIGHTIGLGHTQADGTVVDPTSNIMYPSCCDSATPAPGALGPDDLDGLAFLYPANGACQFVASPSRASYSSAGGSGHIVLTTYALCAWTASPDSPFIAVTSAASGSGSSLVFYRVLPNPGPARAAALRIGDRAVTISQAAYAPEVTLDRLSLDFSAVTSGAAFLAQTSAQTVRVTQSGPGAVAWSATSSQPWLQVSSTPGSGTGSLSISVRPAAGLPTVGTRTGTVTVTHTGAAAPDNVISVTLRLVPNGASAAAFGVVDTPAQNAAGLSGAVPFTGWALDDVEVASVSVCRAPVAGEAAAADGRCGGWAHVYVGDAVFVDGARPDVQVGYPGYPRNGQGGWGLMVLTNMLPAQGNGTFGFSMWARDREGHSTLLGTRTVRSDNAGATLPFGTIDTPGQGETISGKAYLNFGWVLTQAPKMIPADGSTLMVYVDGQAVGSPSYGFYRSDIAGMFPGLANSDGAVGYRYLDTTTLSNGLHTISWAAADNAGSATGIGSRYFRVSNGSAAAQPFGASTSALAARSEAAMPEAALDTSLVQGRRGWATDAPWRRYDRDGDGRIVVAGEEGDRFELQLGAGDVTGYLRVGAALQPLPIGSRLDPATGLFTWAPGVGFLGGYDLVFLRGAASQAVSRREVRVVLRAKGTSQQVVIDTPTSRQSIEQPFLLSGWAADLEAADGTGVDTLHVWAYPVVGGAPVFLGVAPEAPRPDVAAAYGEQFRNAGYGVVVRGLAPGTYDIAVFAWSRSDNGFLPAAVVRVAVR